MADLESGKQRVERLKAVLKRLQELNLELNLTTKLLTPKKPSLILMKFTKWHFIFQRKQLTGRFLMQEEQQDSMGKYQSREKE